MRYSQGQHQQIEFSIKGSRIQLFDIQSDAIQIRHFYTSSVFFTLGVVVENC